MTNTESNASPAQETNGDKMKKYSEKKEEQYQVSESPRSISFNMDSKPASAPTLQESFNNSFSEGDLQRVVASCSLSSLSDGAIKVVKEENKKSMLAVEDLVELVVEDEKGLTLSNIIDDGVFKKMRKWYILLLGLRIAAFVFCKIAFAVLASDTLKKVGRGSSSSSNKSYFDSSYSETIWYIYKEFKYFLSVNVIGFVYSGLQICDIVKYMITKRHIVMDPKLRGYFNFAMDQALAYLLMSASSTAATTARNWRNSGLAAEIQVQMANASVALSFIAFLAFASSSVVSAFIFCRFD